MKIYKDSNSVGSWVAMARVNGEYICALSSSKMDAMNRCFKKIRWALDIEEPKT